MGKEIKLIMSDLDGTLLDGNSRMMRGNVKALKRAYKAGIKIVPITGRHLAGANYVLSSVPMAEYVACCNGSALYDRKNGECLFRDELSTENALKVLDICKDYRCITYAAVNGVFYTDRGSFDKNYSTMDVPNSYRPIAGWSKYENIRQLIEKDDSHLEMLYVVFADEALKKEADIRIKNAADLNTEGAYAMESEITNASANKENMLLRMKDILGVDRENIMAFGDGDNDAGMIRAAGIGVAMANGLESARQAADHITLSNNEKGVAYIINKYLDGEL